MHDPGAYTDRLGRNRHLIRWSCMWEARWDILSVHLQRDPSAVSAEHLLLGWSTVLLLEELCTLFLILVTGRRNQSTREEEESIHVIDCEGVLMLPWSSTAIAGQEHFCFCSFKLMHLCAYLSCCLLPRRKTRKMNWAGKTLKLFAFYPRNQIFVQCKNEDELVL